MQTLGPQKGQKKTQKAAFSVCKDFEQVWEIRKVVLSNLDEWFTAFSKWTLDPVALADTKEEQDKILAQRKELCHLSAVPVRVWSPQSLKTYLNALAKAYNSSSPPHGIVPSIEKQFPNLYALYVTVGKRFRETQGLSGRKRPLKCDCCQEFCCMKCAKLHVLVRSWGCPRCFPPKGPLTTDM